MDIAVDSNQESVNAIRYFDVLIIGAGISGIDAAYHLQKNCPGKSFTLLETQETFGGTWATHKYPGIRSDSDLFTFGFKWKPWKDAPIATADKILRYLNEALDENDLRQHIRFSCTVISASWSSDEARWTLEVANGETGEIEQYGCHFLWMCQGYYRHSEGYMPDYPGRENFKGPVIHPQNWPEDLDYSGKEVVVIGSGATAATLIPAMAGTAGHITMLQRSPTYFFAKPNRDELADTLRALDVPDEWVHEIARRKILYDQKEITRRSFEEPEALRAELLQAAQNYLGDSLPIDPHFTPSYRPWRQRLAFVPDGDLFRAIRRGEASVVTDQIDQFTETGILLKSGKELAADIIISATGFNISVLGDITFTIDGKALDFHDCWSHRAVMFSGVPNMAWVFGYLRTSWTMRSDMVAEFVCRLLRHMTEKGVRSVVPTLREEDRDMPELPFVDPENFNAGYLTRALHLLPKQGDRDPWVHTQNYYVDRETLAQADLEDGTLIYS
ncbi:MAG: FAD-containing monooxygenase EthA [Sneathiella sp.]|jgi:cation diffusion facilitator CzcD-associated flavoprotein CzcO|uniref:flavin-containing monooxygenase n=1 Tax=Sneathiella sp. TaxID=1964365 RepID=UPI000C432348|nr:NAD(P)/FAD-dependent oxidoreductase [Sneathiella sp.]MAL78400.1 FAD-containing monooxygenase EthA [Sneathiella sp.]